MRRFRLLFAAAVLALSIFGIASPALAASSSGQSVKLTEENKCFYDAVQSNPANSQALEDALTACTKAKNPLLPAINELIWGGIGFLIVFLFILWKGYPAVKAGMEARTERIRQDLADAETAKAEAQATQTQYQGDLANAKTESAKIIEEARQTADAVKAERIASLDAEIAELRQRAQAEIEAAKAQAMSDLQGEVATIAIGAAEHVVEKNLDAETNRQLVENFISKVGAS